MKKTHINRYGTSWTSDEPDAKFDVNPDANNLNFDEKYVSLNQDDYNDEYYEQSILVNKYSAEQIIDFLKKEFEIE